ncbi:MBL fold metallo-hydrolase [Acidithiobacillus sp. HP-6]|uniref:MBL fold metallo-hydrolase n=1 Tax=unclassified Acidithiobacillus TaxID=2614800 RepID=UPI0018794B47|nr:MULTISPECIES: MBL fold metallo-hydrolase [unclassified Acidithiobacillus]MBE7562519.1 MBL fold metallo-hydrolase [Acidithiobacillus sp. HP-6]MBE7568018.1 MBL fold metallo-hydrolase [Acidithiobacillus sp. HP-2]
MKPIVECFFDEATFTASYLVKEPEGRSCAIIDPVLDFDYASGRTSHSSADKLLARVREENLQVEWILDTHAHADHLSAADFLRKKLGCKIGIGAHITQVQKTFAQLYDESDQVPQDGRQFDSLFADGETFSIGKLSVQVMHTPGHTPACLTYVIGDAAFVGDTLFMPDYGSARCDFPGGSAETLYHSVQRIFALPEETRLFVGHDYKAPGRDEYRWESTVAEEKAHNIHLGNHRRLADFVALRQKRDATLAMPKLILPALQINIRAGELPPKADNGVAYLRIPLNAV